MIHSTSIPFFKAQGSGNDFVILDNRNLRVPEQDMADWARKLCRRAFGIGADGLILLDNAPDEADADYIWHFYNADGSRAEMCGNGSRCATRLAVELGMAEAEHVLGTDAGTVRAQVFADEDEVRVQLTPIEGLALDLGLTGPEGKPVHFANTGVPHAVVVVDDLQGVDIAKAGSELRYHDHFAPAGTNANFIQVVDRTHLQLRTYERGVEDETFACGTGAAASVAVAHALGLCEPTTMVTTSGGEQLEIGIENGMIFLRGKALIMYKGEFFPKSFGLKVG
jgi:diaminopimelate epimerase